MLLTIPPRVHHHAVCRRQTAGRDGGVAGARYVVKIRVVDLPEPGAVRKEAVQAAGPLLPELIDVVAAELVDDEQNDQPRSGLLSAQERGDNCRHECDDQDLQLSAL